MDLGSLIVAALLSLGLIGTDAVINAGTIRFDIQVTDDLSKAGYTPQLVDAIMANDLKALVDFKSIIRPPEIRTPEEKSIVGAVADSLNLKEVTSAFQADFGVNTVRITGSLMAAGKDKQELRVILAGNSRYTGNFLIDASSGGQSLPAFLQTAADEVVTKLEPYATAVDQFNRLSREIVAGKADQGPAKFSALIDGLIASEARQPDSDVDHAAFHNLLGLVEMMANDPAPAEAAFKMSMMLDSHLGIPAINLGLLYVSQHRFDDAIKTLDSAIATPRVQRTAYLLAYAMTVQALALWGQGDLQGASDQFLRATQTYPAGLWSYFYWAELLDSVGNAHDAMLLRNRAQHNMDIFESYPEVAFLHVRLVTDAGFVARPIDLTSVRHVAEIYAQP
jgi:tetratricopeptide (TPR) repeat protein